MTKFLNINDLSWPEVPNVSNKIKDTSSEETRVQSSVSDLLTSDTIQFKNESTQLPVEPRPLAYYF